MKSACHTGAITTLGRGGSDLTATLLGAALGVDEVQVWKDVDGELTLPRPCCMPWHKGIPCFRGAMCLSAVQFNTPCECCVLWLLQDEVADDIVCPGWKVLMQVS